MILAASSKEAFACQFILGLEPATWVQDILASGYRFLLPSSCINFT
jgi:hypothetical protein